MSDDKTNRGALDRARVSGEELHEVRHFAERHGISRKKAERLIDKHGNSREMLDTAAEAMGKHFG